MCFRCSNQFISGIEYYTRREVLDRSRFNLFIVLWDIADAAFLQLLACKEPPCDGIEAQ